MRGLLKAALVLAPALAYTLVLPDVTFDDAWENDTPVAGNSLLVQLELPANTHSRPLLCSYRPRRTKQIPIT
jgi:hypothetical protein